jgi:hypothetical protein
MSWDFINIRLKTGATLLGSNIIPKLQCSKTSTQQGHHKSKAAGASYKSKTAGTTWPGGAGATRSGWQQQQQRSNIICADSRSKRSRSNAKGQGCSATSQHNRGNAQEQGGQHQGSNIIL